MSGAVKISAGPIASDLLWKTPPDLIEARYDEVQVWRASLDGASSSLQTLSRILSEDERERAGRFHFERDRDRFVATRALLRILIGRYLKQNPSDVEFTYGPNGKPFLAGDEATDLRFNLSHSGPFALYAVTWGREIGVDLEYNSENVDIEGLAQRFFSPREVAALKSLPEHEKQEAFFACWTRKEAYIKARGEGLSVALDSFSVSLNPNEPAALIEVRDNPGETSRWALIELDPGPRYAGALAVEGRDWRLRCWQVTGDMQDLLVPNTSRPAT